jgi:hypothetical protein
MPRPITITTNPLSSKTLQTFEVNANNLVAMSKKLGTLIRRHKGSSKSNGTIAKELNNFLAQAEDLVNGGEDRKNFGSCKCTHPPSMGFCVEGMCIKAKWSFKSMEGGLTITINI